MEIIIELLEDLHPEIDFNKCKTLIDHNILDSFDIVTMVTDLSEEFDINITVAELTPENFNSAKAIYEMVQKLMD